MNKQKIDNKRIERDGEIAVGLFSFFIFPAPHAGRYA
jgi:hypothetical protein